MDVSPPAVENRLAEFRRRCADLALAMTPQRQAIYQVLAADDSHPGAEDIFRRIKPTFPSLSLGTVYRTLNLFVEQGLISRVQGFDDQARFDANLEGHHHLVCVRCRRVTDFQDPTLERLPIGANQLAGFHVLEQRIHFLGICPGCQRQA